MTLMNDPARYHWMAVHILPFERELRGWLRHHLSSVNSAEIDDLVQEVFARVWVADFSTIHNSRAYLFATVRHLLVEYARHRRIVPIELLGEVQTLNLVSEEPGPERLVGARQELERLRAIVATLPTQCRRVFIMRKFEGLSHREIAERMGISGKTVVNHLTIALARISEAIGQDPHWNVSMRGRARPSHREGRDRKRD